LRFHQPRSGDAAGAQQHERQRVALGDMLIPAAVRFKVSPGPAGTQQARDQDQYNDNDNENPNDKFNFLRRSSDGASRLLMVRMDL
jgi:hypothetical protein